METLVEAARRPESERGRGLGGTRVFFAQGRSPKGLEKARGTRGAGRGRLWLKGRQRRSTGPAGQPASLPYPSGKALRGRRSAPRPRTAQERRRGLAEAWEGLSLWTRGSRRRHALTIAEGLHFPLLRQPTYTVTRLRSHRPARAASLPIGGPLADAPHWHRAGVGGANRRTPGAGPGAVRSRPGLIGQDHAASADWLSQHRTEPIPLVEEPRQSLGSRGRGEKGAAGRWSAEDEGCGRAGDSQGAAYGRVRVATSPLCRRQDWKGWLGRSGSGTLWSGLRLS